MISPSKSPSKLTFEEVDDGGGGDVSGVACVDGTSNNKSLSKLLLGVASLVTGGVDGLGATFGPPNKSFASFCFLCSDSEISSCFSEDDARGGGGIVGNGCC